LRAADANINYCPTTEFCCRRRCCCPAAAADNVFIELTDEFADVLELLLKVLVL
jgi:hypothetical protein